MAAKSVEKSAENDNETPNISSITVLDSEDEEEQSTDELFKGFIKAVEPFLERKELLLLRVKFQAVGSDFKCSSRFKDMLRRKTNQVHKVDVYIHFNEVLNAIIGNAAVYGGIGFKKKQKSELNSEKDSSQGDIGQKKKHDRFKQTADNDALAGIFENAEDDRSRGKTTSNRTNKSSDKDVEIIELVSSFSQSGSSAEKFQDLKNTEKNEQKERMKIKQRKLIAKLETKLKYTSDEIKRLSQAELSLEEMQCGDSSYIMESRLKKRFNNIWNKICKLKGRPTNTGRVIEGEIRSKKSGFPVIDKAVGKFLKKRKGFPDIFDIRNLIMKVNKKRGLGLTQSVQNDIAADLLTDIGNKLQKKRKKDFDYNFGCHLTDECLPSLDPALNNTSLRQKLEENKRINQNALESIFEKYVHLDRAKDHKNNNSYIPTSESEFESEEESHHSKKRKYKSSSENDSEDAKTSKKKSKRKKISVNNSKDNISIGDAPGTSGTSATSVITLKVDELCSVENENSKSRKENSANGNEGNPLVHVSESATVVPMPEVDKSCLEVVESVQLAIDDSNLLVKYPCAVVVEDKDKVVPDTIQSAVDSNELESVKFATNSPLSKATTAKPKAQSVQRNTNCFSHNVVEIIDNDSEGAEAHDAVTEESEGHLQKSCEERIQKRKVLLNSSKLMDKIKELREKKLSSLKLDRSSNILASPNQQKAAIDYPQSKRKATSVQCSTFNQEHLGNLSNGFVSKNATNNNVNIISDKGEKAVPIHSHCGSQQKKTTGLKESLDNCPKSQKNEFLLQNIVNNSSKQTKFIGILEESSPQHRISETVFSKFSPNGRLNSTVIIVSDDEDE